VLSLLSFSTLRPLRDFILLSPTDGEYLDALLAIFLLKQPLAECFWVFINLAKISQLILPQITELKEFSLLK
jgi:hypothetical protein